MTIAAAWAKDQRRIRSLRALVKDPDLRCFVALLLEAILSGRSVGPEMKDGERALRSLIELRPLFRMN